MLRQLHGFLLATFVAITLACTAHAQTPTTLENDDSCDIVQGPAATLLLPHFRVGLSAPPGTAVNTVFALTNTRVVPQIAHVTLWTDLHYPVLTFDVFLRGYDLQRVSLYDVIARGVLPPTTSAGASDSGPYANPHFQSQAYTACSEEQTISTAKVAAVQNALTNGTYSDGVVHHPNVGSQHEEAAGYLTVDVVSTCTTLTPAHPAYHDSVILFDNALLGEYSVYRPADNTVRSAPMVHVRAVPQGGPAGASTATNLPFTFYDRFTPAANRKKDRRQPLPSTFASRWIAAGASFDTTITVWQEGTATSAETLAGDVGDQYFGFKDVVRFDENGNSVTHPPCNPCPAAPASARISIGDNWMFPTMYEIAGWVYLNLGHGSSAYSAPRQNGALSGTSQGWVTADMFAEGRYETGIEATPLGNGCSPSPPISDELNPIAPAPNANATFGTGSPATTSNDDSCDLGLAPAATLLLPNFEVDVNAGRSGVTSLVALVNTSAAPQIASFTIWTDRGYPVLSFNIFMPGYDVQAINLYDIIATGMLPATSSTMPEGSRALPNSSGNPLHESLESCEDLPQWLSSEMVARVQGLLINGSYGALSGVGNSHPTAMGSITVDVVKTCTALNPSNADYYTEALLFDNVLTGDVIQVESGQDLAGGTPLVHIRAVPDGGESNLATALPFTFYDRFTPASNRQMDRRQPLPGVMAVSYIDDLGSSAAAVLRFWREGTASASSVAAASVAANASIPFAEVVRFDEFTETITALSCTNCGTAESGALSVHDGEVMPPPIAGSVAGWLYLDLNNGQNGAAYSTARQPGGSHAGSSQNWVTLEQTTEGRYQTLVSGAVVVNGCTPAGESTLDLRRPTNVVATATAATTVLVTWGAVAEATGYEVVRQSATGTQVIARSTNSYVDTVGANQAYLYRVRALRTEHAPSPDSAADLASTFAFTDSSLVAGSTVIKVAHVTDLRAAVNGVRALTSLGAFTFTDTTLAGQRPRAVHLTELRTALDAARLVLGLPALSHANAIGAGTLIRRADVVSLRAGVQ